MDHTTLYATLFYFLSYRLAILLLGAASIYLGYRLFLKGFDHGATGGPELNAKAGQLNLTLRNAAPGTFFAAFGAIITTVILVASPPQFDYSDNGTDAKTQVSASEEQRTITLRGRDAGPVHNQIWQEDYPALLKKAQGVVAMAPDNPDYHDTLASIYFLGNKYENAAKAEALAVDKAKAGHVKQEGIADLQKKLELYRRFVP